MNGLDLFRSPKTAADEIADIVSAQCPPVVPENCDAFSCRECWLAWLTTGEPPKEKGPSDKQTAPGRDSAPYYPPTEAIRKAAERLKDGNMEYTAICGNAIDRQPRNGGNGIGIQNDVAYTLTSADRHAIFRRQRVDKFREDDTASTQSARQGKDATDLICQPSRDTLAVFLIRRLTPLECERLQGFPDGWTDLPGASDSARYKALGNSVPVPCVEYIMAGIARAAEGG